MPTTAIYSRFEGTVVDVEYAILGIKTMSGVVIYLLHGTPTSGYASVGAVVHIGAHLYDTDSLIPGGGSCIPAGNCAHLHFEVRLSAYSDVPYSSHPFDDVNPEAWLNSTGCSLPCVDGLYGDVVGNGLADLVSVNETQVFVMLSTGATFNPPGSWWTQQGSAHVPYGTFTTLLGDVTGDGKADIVGVNGRDTWVMTSTGSGFNDPVSWSSTPFFGTRATLLADVTGDGRLDLVAVNDSSVYVMVSNGTSFAFPAPWFQYTGIPPNGGRATLLGDVTGDGKADLIAVNDTNTLVLSSTGSGFSYPSQWSSTPFYGDKTTLVGDVSSDGKADLVAVDNGSTYVMTSTGSGFSFPALWANQPFYGTRATLLAHVQFVQFHYAASLVAVNESSTWVMTSTGTSFNPPAMWWNQAFYGSRATL